jgi:hypothetical protein
MSDWLHDLPVVWMAFVVFGTTYLVTAAIHAVVTALAVGERARSFKAVSPGMLPPVGILFGLFVAFTAAQVWSDADRANAAVNREASALRSVILLSASFPQETGMRLGTLIRSYIEEAFIRALPGFKAYRRVDSGGRAVPSAEAATAWARLSRGEGFSAVVRGSGQRRARRGQGRPAPCSRPRCECRGRCGPRPSSQLAEERRGGRRRPHRRRYME